MKLRHNPLFLWALVFIGFAMFGASIMLSIHKTNLLTQERDDYMWESKTWKYRWFVLSQEYALIAPLPYTIDCNENVWFHNNTFFPSVDSTLKQKAGEYNGPGFQLIGEGVGPGLVLDTTLDRKAGE